MDLEQLIMEFKTNADRKSDVEKAIEVLTEQDDLTPVKHLMISQDNAVKFTAVKIIEQRIKFKKMQSMNLKDEIYFMNEAILVMPTEKTAQVYALLGLFEWPAGFPEFFTTIVDLISRKNSLGYSILHNFLYLVNYSQEIDDARKRELKTAIGMMSNNYMALFNPEFAQYIIPILTESLRILPKGFNYDIVFEKGPKYPERAIEFLNESAYSSDLKRAVNFASQIETKLGMVMYFNSFRNKIPKISNIRQMYEYMYKALRKDLTVFGAALEFWIRLFSSKEHESMVMELLSEIISIFVSVDEELKAEVEGEVLGFINVVSKNYPKEVENFLAANGKFLSRKIASYVLHKLYANPNFHETQEMTFEDPFVLATLYLLKKNSNAVNCVRFLDFTDKDSCKLVIKIMQSFKLTEDQVTQILNQCNVPNKEYANEIIVDCFLFLNRNENWDEEWTTDKICRFFYYLKKMPELVSHLAPSYYSLFMQSAPFDRCFAILKMLQNVPREIYEKMYADLDKYPFIELNCFNRDLLGYLEIQQPFVEKEVYRLVNEWKDAEDVDDLIACTKALIQVFSDGVIKSNTLSQNYRFFNDMLTLLEIDEPSVIKKITDVILAYRGTFDTRKAVYLLLLNYNLGSMTSAHTSIASAITHILKQVDAASVLYEVLGVSLDKCMNLRTEVIKSQTRRAQNLVREFLQEYKGKPLNKLYASTFKVGGQNFITKQKTTGKLNFEIDRSFFNA